jgi:hypothetical protein
LGIKPKSLPKEDVFIERLGQCGHQEAIKIYNNSDVAATDSGTIIVEMTKSGKR